MASYVPAAVEITLDKSTTPYTVFMKGLKTIPGVGFDPAGEIFHDLDEELEETLAGSMDDWFPENEPEV